MVMVISFMLEASVTGVIFVVLFCICLQPLSASAHVSFASFKPPGFINDHKREHPDSAAVCAYVLMAFICVLEDWWFLHTSIVLLFARFVQSKAIANVLMVLKGTLVPFLVTCPSFKLLNTEWNRECVELYMEYDTRYPKLTNCAPIEVVTAGTSVAI